MRTPFFNILAMLVGAALSVGGALYAVEAVERRSLEAVAQAIRDDGIDWVSVTTDGLQIHLTGTAPDEAMRFRALTLAGTVVDGDRLIDAMDVRPAEAAPPPHFVLEILRNGDGISLIGLIPAEVDRDRLRDRVRRIAGSARVADLLEVADYPRPEGWDDAVAFSLDALSALPRAKISASADRVAVTAITDSLADKRRIEASLSRAAPAGTALSLEIAAPRPVIAPFTLRFLIESGAGRFDACSADTEEARAAILQAALAAGLAGKTDCTLGLGVPSPRWGEAAAAAIGALARIGGGSVTFSDADVSLVAAAGTDPALFDREVGELEAALPDVFSLDAVLPELPERADPAAPAPPEFTATRNAEGRVELRGRLGDARTRAVVESFAQARFGAAQTHVATRIDEDLPDGWSVRVLAALDALGQLAEGRAVVGPEEIRIAGVTGNERASDEIARMMAERLGEDALYDLDVAYREELDPVAAIPTPAECVTRIDAAASDQKITFDPGSADLEPSARATLDQIATILRECGPITMEIAGFTDSQGREEMNLALSRSRAESVLTALMDRRVLTSGLTAAGYGEADPIADNATAEGREANRRIEFRLVEDAEEEPQSGEAAAEETAKEPGEEPAAGPATDASADPAADADAGPAETAEPGAAPPPGVEPAADAADDAAAPGPDLAEENDR